jgi:hypothetical protein
VIDSGTESSSSSKKNDIFYRRWHITRFYKVSKNALRVIFPDKPCTDNLAELFSQQAQIQIELFYPWV